MTTLTSKQTVASRYLRLKHKVMKEQNHAKLCSAITSRHSLPYQTMTLHNQYQSIHCDFLRLSRFTLCNKKPNKSFPSLEPFTPGLTDLLQFVQDPSQLLLSICQLPTTRIVHTKATHDGIHNDQGETILVIDHQTSCFHQKLFEMLRGIAFER